MLYKNLILNMIKRGCITIVTEIIETNKRLILTSFKRQTTNISTGGQFSVYNLIFYKALKLQNILHKKRQKKCCLRSIALIVIFCCSHCGTLCLCCLNLTQDTACYIFCFESFVLISIAVKWTFSLIVTD